MIKKGLRSDIYIVFIFILPALLLILGFTRPSLAAGNTTRIQDAIYPADPTFTITSMDSSPNPSVYGQEVTFTATVKANEGSTPTGTVTFMDGVKALGTSKLNEGDPDIATFTTSALSAGTHPINAVYNGDTNFAGGVCYGKPQLVDRKALSIKADAKSKTYGQLDPALTYQLTSGSLVSNDAFTGNLARVAGENAGSYAIQQGTLIIGSNYALNYVGADFTIIPRAASVVVIAGAKIYGDPDPVFTGMLNGLLPNDNMMVTFSRTSGESVTGGPYIISATLPSTIAGNYNAAIKTANFTISARPLSVAAETKSKNYGDTDPALTFAVVGLPGFDDLQGSLIRDPGSNAGIYAINQGTLDNVHNSNYNIRYSGAYLTINKATPVFSNLSSLTTNYGSSPATLGGYIRVGALVPSGAVSVTLNGITQMATIGDNGYFSSKFITDTMAAASYPVTYTYSGDANFNYVSDNSQNLIVQGGIGGNGGLASPGSRVTLNGFSITKSLEIDNNGIIMEEAKLTSRDGQCILTIPSKTRLLSDPGNALLFLTVEVISSPPPPPADNAPIMVYSFGPDGAMFNPPINLILSYNGITLPGNIQENSLFIASWDGSRWVSLNSNLDTSAHTVSASINHFSIFSLFGKVVPPAPIPTPSSQGAAAEFLPKTQKPTETALSRDVPIPALTSDIASTPTAAQLLPVSLLVLIYVIIFTVVVSLTVILGLKRRRRI